MIKQQSTTRSSQEKLYKIEWEINGARSTETVIDTSSRLDKRKSVTQPAVLLIDRFTDGINNFVKFLRLIRIDMVTRFFDCL